MAKSKKVGLCALCGKGKELTFEHIPPKAALNNTKVNLYSGEVLLQDEDRMPWDLTGVQYEKQLQKGAGKFSLCEDCNNLTGTWYGSAYQHIALCVAHALQGNVENCAIHIDGVYPLRFIKQVISMFCSVNNYESLVAYSTDLPSTDGYDSLPEFHKLIVSAKFGLYNAACNIEMLRKFVLNRDSVGLDKNKFKLCMYLCDGTASRQNGITAKLDLNHNSIEVLSEISFYPLGFILYFNPKPKAEYLGIDITNFADYSYDTNGSLEFPLKILPTNSYFPADFRSKVEIKQCIQESRAFMNAENKEHNNSAENG